MPDRARVALSLAAVLLLALAGCGQSEQTTSAVEQPDRLPAAAFFETVSYRLAPGRAWSADGTRLLVGSDETGTPNVYALAADGSGSTALTEATDSAQLPVSWFPNDDRVLFTADEGGNELHHLYVRELDGRRHDLTPGRLKAAFGGWSTDGSAFYVFSNERDAEAFDLYVYASSDYERRLIFRNDEQWAVAGVSRDGARLVLTRSNSSADNDLYLLALDAVGASPQLITPHDGAVNHRVFGFSPDSRSLVFGTDAHGEFSEAWSYDVATGAMAPLVQADWDVVFVDYSDSGRYRVSGINADARVSVTIIDSRDGSELALPDLPPGMPGSIRFAPGERRLALRLGTDATPGDVYVVDLDAGETRRLTRALSPALDESRLVRSEVVRYPSFDGLEIPGILYRPPGASAERPAPGLVWVHGGPGGQSGRYYSGTLQHLLSHGYAILAPNNRGSSGYGKTFFHLDDRRHGEVDLDDIVYARRYLAGLNWVDGDRIGIIGGSYGGYLVGAALAFRPDEFRVGIDIFGVMNWLRTLESIPPWWTAERNRLYDEMGDPATDAERLRRISPLFHAENIDVPLLVVQGANDPRVLQVESDEIVAAVRANEVPVEYIVFEDEGHGFSQRANRITASDAYVAFLDRYLTGAETKEDNP